MRDEVAGNHMQTVYVVIYAIGWGGRTVAIADQCRMFRESGSAPVIVTFNYDRDLHRHERQYREQGMIDPGTSVINAHEEMRRLATVDETADWSRAEDLDETALSVAESAKGDQQQLHYFDRRGSLVKHRLVEDGVRVRTNFYTQGRLTCSREYDERDFCSRETTIDASTGKVSEERYFTPDGFCYATRLLDPENGKQQGVFWHEGPGLPSRRFGHNTPWHAAWLDSLLSQTDPRPLAVAESASAVLKLLDTRPSSSVRMFMCHENHLADPYTLGAPIRVDYGNALERTSSMPALVVPTQAQADDLRRQFGSDNRIIAIPNLVRDKRGGAVVEKRSGHIGAFTRLAPSKRVDVLIECFAKVVSDMPEAHLDLYGDGPDRKKLEALTAELGLQQHVTFHGRKTEIGREMAECVATATTSITESFGLSVAESLAAATPVVSFAVNYGPRDLIRDGVDGLLVEPGDRDGFSQAMIELLRDEPRAHEMGERGAQRMAAEFSEEPVTRAWQEAVRVATEHA